MEAEAVYLSLLPVEHAPLYHVCPGGLAARLVLPSGWGCRVCRFSELLRNAEPRRLTERVLARLRVSRPQVVIVDGVEPLANKWALELPHVLEGLLGYRPVMVFSTAGALGPGVVREALEAGYVGVLFEYVLHLEKPPHGLGGATAALGEAARRAPVVEVALPLRGREDAAVAAGLANRYPWVGLHLFDAGAGDLVYSVAERLQSRRVNAYPHPDESYAYSDTLCTSCGAVLVSRKPWGVRVHAEPDKGLARCPRCGAEARLLLGCRGARAVSIHRELTIW